VVHKDVLSQADILIAMKLTASQDRDAIGAWIEGQADRQEGKRILGDLPRLQRVEGYLWAPGHSLLERVSFPPIRTFDSSRTPKRGERLAIPHALAEVDLSAIVAALAAAAEDPGKPKEDRPRHFQLEQELVAAKVGLQSSRRTTASSVHGYRGTRCGYSARIRQHHGDRRRMPSENCRMQNQCGRSGLWPLIRPRHPVAAFIPPHVSY
jgi:hypothetical protein